MIAKQNIVFATMHYQININTIENSTLPIGIKAARLENQILD
jgi:hypothetical protein